MWLRRSNTTVRVHSASSPKFACSTFKDVHALLAEEGAEGSGDGLDSPSICHRSRAAKTLARTLSSSSTPAPHLRNEAQIWMPGAEKTVVVYFTSLRVVRRTFDDCAAVRSILRAFRIPIDERDVSMDSGFVVELQRILGLSQKSSLTLPRVFICGRYIGGADEIRRLHESGELKKHVEGLPSVTPGTCEVCNGYAFILCRDCNGSRKCYSHKSGFRSCTSCNENGLLRCPSCFPSHF